MKGGEGLKRQLSLLSLLATVWVTNTNEERVTFKTKVGLLQVHLRLIEKVEYVVTTRDPLLLCARTHEI